MSNYIEIKPEDLNKSAFQMIGNEWMLVTAEKDSKANTMTASWGGFGVMWNKNVTYIVLRPQRYTKEFIDSSDTYSLCFFDSKYKKQLAYLGAVSGRDEDKIEKAKLTLNKYEDVPYFEEGRLTFICRKLYAQEMEEKDFIDKSIIDSCYPNRDYHTMYVVEIEKILEK